MAFPGSLPAAGSAVSSDTLAAAGHTALHNGSDNEIRAIATKVGTGSSTATSGTVLGGTGAGTSAWRQVDLTADVTGALPINKGGTNATTAADARTSLGINTALETLALVYPVGSIYINATNSTNPATLLGFGTWSAFAAGRVIVGDGTSDQAFAAGAQGGESNHTLTTAEMPAHEHDPTARFLSPDINDGTNSPTGGATWGARTAEVTSSTGGGGSHNILQPWIGVYMWKRVS